MASELRHRQTATRKKSNNALNEIATSGYPKGRSVAKPEQNLRLYRKVNAILTIFAFATRFYIINYPSEVVFDEVHFGKFASFYLQRTYFFDLHPPFAKLLIAAVGWVVGYDGAFKFDNIGESYITNQVPYVAYRTLSATLGALTVPVIFRTLQECGFSVWACAVGGALVLFDNAHVAETRLILLDATLIFSIALSILCYVRFSKLRQEAFSRKWWTSLFATGVALSCVISTKYVGVFTFMMVGGAVLIDLWNLLDYRQGLTIRKFFKHFFARAFGLIVVPLIIFLFWFWVHFSILTKSGPGDAFMTPEFQETLGDNILARESRPINYYDKITLRHKSTEAILHSHEAHYPLRYEDGRISSQGQQVTGYGHPDENNVWQILPAVDFAGDDREGHPVFGSNQVRFLHVATNTMLITHDVASPTFPTNQEFTTVSIDDADGGRYNDTLFELRLNSGSRDAIKTKSGLLKVIHVPTQVAMWTHTKHLPDWGFGQFEINGNKNSAESSNTWYFDEIVDLTDPERLKYVEKESKHMPFLKKYLELQLAMFAQNNALTASHPYASEPITWPFLIRGVSFWTHDSDRSQIYFVGNFIGWWLEAALIAVTAGVMVADQLTRRRNFHAINNIGRSKLYNSIGFFAVGWMCHYFPFFLMGRQKFLHHYLPAHLIAALLSGGMVDFVLGEFDDEVLDAKKKGTYKHAKIAAFSILILSGIIACFYFLAPLTYGAPGLDVAQVHARQLMKIELHYAK